MKSPRFLFPSAMMTLTSLALLGGGALENAQAKDRDPAELFALTKIWDAHFQFTAEQWAAMEPEGGKSFPGMFGGGRPPGGGNGGEPSKGPGGFRPPGMGMFLAPGFLKAGDQDQDGKLSKAEFQGLGEKWFGEWDKEKTGQLNGDQVKAGLNSALGQPGFGPPGMPGANGRGFLQGADGKRNGLSSMMGIEFKDVHADLEFNGETFRDIAVRYKGNGTFMESRASLKRSLKVDLNEFVKGQKLAGLSKLNFHNNITDPSGMNEVLSLRLFRDAEVPASRSAFARVYVTVAGKYDRQYFGLYSLIENVDDNFAKDRFDSKKGALFKPSTPRPFTDLGDDWKAYHQLYDPKTELTIKQSQRIIEFCKLVSKASDEEFATRLADYLDLDQFARFMAVTVYLSSTDSILGIGQNYYVYLHPKTQKLQFLPWDHDHSFGQFPMGGPHPENLAIHHPWSGENLFLDRVFKVEAFKKLYLVRMEEFNQTLFAPERLRQQVDVLAPSIRPAVEAESEEKLSRFDRAIAGEATAPTPFPGAPPGQPVHPLKSFVVSRAQSIADQLTGKSEGEIPGSAFGGRGAGRPGPDGTPAKPREFGPGAFGGPVLVKSLDANQDGTLERDEWTLGFETWFTAWDADASGSLTEDQLRSGMNRDLVFTFPGAPEKQPAPSAADAP